MGIRADLRADGTLCPACDTPLYTTQQYDRVEIPLREDLRTVPQVVMVLVVRCPDCGPLHGLPWTDEA